jgi:4-methylaminobutanoate oxidase (formaldehyde-forming)
MPFHGREACAAIAARPLAKMLAGFTTEDPDVVLAGRETILRDGEFAGYLTSGGYGYSIGRPVGYGYVRNSGGVTRDYVLAGNYELVVAEERVKASVHLEPLHDPEGSRIRS